MPPDGDVPRTLSGFREATMELDNIYSMFPKACNLSEAEYWSLLFIYEGTETQSAIGSRLYLSRQTLNSAFKQLQAKGLVKLMPYEDNRRSKRAVLTDSGNEFVERICSAHAQGRRAGVAETHGRRAGEPDHAHPQIQ